MDLASFEVVDRCADALTDILAEGLVDIVFANEEEASALSALRSRSHVLSDMTTSLAAATEPGDGATERETAACVAGDAVERERAVFGAGDNSRSSSHAKAQCSGVRRLRSRAAPVAVRALSSGCDAETLESPVERVACAAGYGVPLGSVGAEEEPYEGSEVRTMMEHILGGYGERGGAAVCVVSLGGRGCVAMRQGEHATRFEMIPRSPTCLGSTPFWVIF